MPLPACACCRLGSVSIRARHCWRAMPPGRRRGPCGNRFQSAPAIAGGRCRSSLRVPLTGNCFNPRPPLLAGDASTEWSKADHSSSFNPRPPLLAGDANDRGRLSAHGYVSIRARHCWRAMRVKHGDLGVQNLVSIRARHCWRAMPCRRATGCRGCCFNPRPPLLAGDARLVSPSMRSKQFQSAPAIAGGRCSRCCWCPRRSSCFNPRPPLLAGDASRRAGSRRASRCFNPRPPLLAGDATG